MLKEEYQQILNSENFRAIMRSSYLVSCFRNEDPKTSKSSWEYNFYTREGKCIYSFFINNDVTILKDTNFTLIKKENPEELKIMNLKLAEKEVEALVNYLLGTKYKDDRVTKLIMSIEMDKVITWNVTAILKNMTIINVRINDSNSQVIEDKVVSPFLN